MDKKISILAISDIHVGCPRLNPRLLHDRFVKFLYPQMTKDVSILFVCGDFFDSLLTMNAIASLEAIEIIKELKRICRENEIDLRVLRGTFSHDRSQPLHFIHGEDPNDTVVQLYDTLSFEYNARTGLNIVYIPDNLKRDNIYDDLRKLLDSHNLERADILIHHGYFKHMLPPNIQAPYGCLEADQIKKYVKGCVLNGHVHISSIYQNVISIGSFDRLAHNEEGAKGFYRIDIDTNGTYHFSFIENKEATKFLSFDLNTFEGMGSEAVQFFTKKWNETIKSFRPNEEVRIRIVSADPGIVEGCAQVARSTWPSVTIDKATVRKREQILENVNLGLDELPVLTPSNIEEMLLPVVQKRFPNTSAQDVHDVISMCVDPKKE